MNTPKQKKMDVVTKMAIIGGAGMIILVLLIGIISIAMKGSDNKKHDKVDNTVESTEPPQTSRGPSEAVRALAIIKDVDKQNNKLSVVNIETYEKIELNVDGSVDIKDEYNTLKTLAQLKTGDIIETKYDKNTLRPEFIQISGQVTQRKNISGLKVDSVNNTVQIGNDLYKYTDDLVTLFAGSSFDLSSLDPVDVVNAKVYKDTVWTIEVVKTHGYIVLKNHQKYIGGQMEVNKSTLPVNEETKVTVGVGVHSIIVSKDGMAPYITEVLVEENAEVIIDLSEAKPVTAMVTFNINPSDVTLTIDGSIYTDFTEPIILDFGTYNIRIEKENYLPWESTLVVNKAVMTVDIKLNQKPAYLYVDGPVGSVIYVDGSYSGIIPVSIPIDPGAHKITIQKDGYYTKEYDITIKADGKDTHLTFPELIQMPVETTNPQPQETEEPVGEGE